MEPETDMSDARTSEKSLCPYHGTAYTNECVCCGAAMYRNRQERLENADPDAARDLQQDEEMRR
jgi:hypothetical protein